MRGHGVGGCVVDWESEEEEEEGVSQGIGVVIDEGGPGLRARRRKWILPGYWVGRSKCGEMFGLGWPVRDADLSGVLRPGWMGYGLAWFARRVISTP